MSLESRFGLGGGGHDASLRLFAVLGVLMMAIAALPVVCDDAADAVESDMPFEKILNGGTTISGEFIPYYGTIRCSLEDFCAVSPEEGSSIDVLEGSTFEIWLGDYHLEVFEAFNENVWHDVEANMIYGNVGVGNEEICHIFAYSDTGTYDFTINGCEYNSRNPFYINATFVDGGIPTEVGVLPLEVVVNHNDEQPLKVLLDPMWLPGYGTVGLEYYLPQLDITLESDSEPIDICGYNLENNIIVELITTIALQFLSEPFEGTITYIA